MLALFDGFLQKLLKREKFSSSSDVWSFAITCLEVLTRKQPYPHRETISSFLANIDVEHDNVAKQIPTDCSQTQIALLTRCFSKDPPKRPTFEEICKTLDQEIRNSMPSFT